MVGVMSESQRATESSRLLTPEAVAEALQVSLRTLRRIVAAGKLDTVAVGGRSVRFSQRALSAYITAHEHHRRRAA